MVGESRFGVLAKPEIEKWSGESMFVEQLLHQSIQPLHHLLLVSISALQIIFLSGNLGPTRPGRTSGGVQNLVSLQAIRQAIFLKKRRFVLTNIEFYPEISRK